MKCHSKNMMGEPCSAPAVGTTNRCVISGVGGIQTVVLKGDPNETGVYTIMLRVPAHTQIAAHSHPDDRVATVISGTWRIGYGDKFDESRLKALPPGSYYTEPPGQNHFAETGDEPVVVQITGFGPSSTEIRGQSTRPALSKTQLEHPRFLFSEICEGMVKKGFRRETRNRLILLGQIFLTC
jgi:quercetin dioxygenase-like cupin family protein